MRRNMIAYGQIKLVYDFRIALYFFVYDYISSCTVCRYTIVQNVIVYGETQKEKDYFILTVNKSRKVI